MSTSCVVFVVVVVVAVAFFGDVFVFDVVDVVVVEVVVVVYGSCRSRFPRKSLADSDWLVVEGPA